MASTNKILYTKVKKSKSEVSTSEKFTLQVFVFPRTDEEIVHRVPFTLGSDNQSARPEKGVA